MGKEEVERIKKIFEDLELNPEYLEHEEVVTSEEAARLRGFELKQGVKAIILAHRAYREKSITGVDGLIKYAKSLGEEGSPLLNALSSG